MEFTRESIFTSSIRALCTGFAVVIGILLGGMLVLAGMGALSSGSNLIPETSDMTVVPDASGNRTVLSESSPAILRLDIHGVIGMKELTASNIENLLLDSREGLLQGNRVKAIFLHMNTPGGTVDDADGIYRALQEYKKKYQVPIYAYVEGLCASGGMYIASAADKIYASPTSIIGSVGVILGPFFNVADLMAKYGVASDTITAGKDKDTLSPFRPWKPDEDKPYRALTDYFYERFVNIVTTARPRLDKSKLINEYGAHIFCAPLAEQYGYIDVADSDYAAALGELVKVAKIEDKQPYQVIMLSPKRPFLSQFTESSLKLLSGKLEHTFQIGPFINSEMSGKFLYLYQPSAP